MVLMNILTLNCRGVGELVKKKQQKELYLINLLHYRIEIRK